MAWIITANHHDRVTSNPIGNAEARVLAMKRVQEDLHSHFPMGHELYRAQVGFSNGIRHGEVSEPFELEIERYSKPLLGLFDSGLGKVISDTGRRVIERLEPGVHQFFPVKLVMRDGSASGETYFFLNICNRKDTVAVEESIGVVTRWPDKEKSADHYFYGCRRDKLGGIAVHHSKIQGLAIWYDWRIKEVMLSDEAVDALISENVTRFEENEPYFLHKIREV